METRLTFFGVNVGEISWTKTAMAGAPSPPFRNTASGSGRAPPCAVAAPMPTPRSAATASATAAAADSGRAPPGAAPRRYPRRQQAPGCICRRFRPRAAWPAPARPPPPIPAARRLAWRGSRAGNRHRRLDPPPLPPPVPAARRLAWRGSRAGNRHRRLDPPPLQPPVPIARRVIKSASCSSATAPLRRQSPPPIPGAAPHLPGPVTAAALSPPPAARRLARSPGAVTEPAPGTAGWTRRG